jgi:hypothetical protein
LTKHISMVYFVCDECDREMACLFVDLKKNVEYKNLSSRSTRTNVVLEGGGGEIHV